MRKVPVIIIAGFLGAGKTSMVNYILKNNQDKKFGLIVNDFGQINIDQMLLNTVSTNTAEFSNGCICCQVSSSEIDETLDKFTDPKDKFDAIIIETSGIAEPLDVKKLILYSANKSIIFDGIIYVVDGLNFEETLNQEPELEQHILYSDILAINKSDQISPDQLQKIELQLSKINSRATIIHSDHGSIDSSVIFDNLKSNQTDQKAVQLGFLEPDHHVHDKFDSIYFSETKPLNYKQTIAFLKSEKSIYRAKGFAYFGVKGYEQKIEIHKVGNYIYQAVGEWQEDETPKTDLVLIGKQINQKELHKKLMALVDQNPDATDSDEFVDIMRLKGF